MSLFAHRFLTAPEDEPLAPGHYDDRRAVRIDEAGLPVVETLQAQPTRGKRDRCDVLGTITKAERDRDDCAQVQLTTKAAGERAKDLGPIRALWAGQRYGN